MLGQYFAAMYPERVGRVVIDGVYDAHDYRAGSWQTNLADTEEVVSSLFDFCHRAGPRKCALYEPTPGAIRARYFDAVASVAEHPFPVTLADPPFVVTRKALLAQLFHASYTPLTAFSAVVDTVVALEARNASALAALAPKLAGEIPKCDCAGDAAAPWLASTEAFGAIACGDAEAVKYDPAAFAAYYDALALARKERACPESYPPDEWGVGEALLYGEVVTSTQTMLDKCVFYPICLSTLSSSCMPVLTSTGSETCAS